MILEAVARTSRRRAITALYVQQRYLARIPGDDLSLLHFTRFDRLLRRP